MFDPARSADPPIIFGIFDTISKNFSEHFLVAIGSKDLRYSNLTFSISELIELLIKLFLFEVLLLNLSNNDHPCQLTLDSFF